MRFQEYILSEKVSDGGKEKRSVGIKKEEAIKFFTEKCKKYSKDKANPALYRGINGNGPYNIVDPTKHERTSAYTSNHTTLLMDNLPSWKNYPKRSRSVICTLAGGVAGGYGRKFRVIPSDGCKFGVCPRSDVWYSFSDFLKGADVSEFNDTLKHHGIKDTNFAALTKGLIDFEKKIKLHAEGDPVADFDAPEENIFGPLISRAMRGKPIEIMKWLDSVMSPDFNDFTTDIKRADQEAEVWVGNGPVLLIENIKYEDFLYLVNGNK